MHSRRNFFHKLLMGCSVLMYPKFLFGRLNKDLPNVLILGDSISIGYTPFVKELMKGKANVYRPMLNEENPENCSGTIKGVESIGRWLKNPCPEVADPGIKWNVIHFNFGLHDLKHVNPVTGDGSSKAEDPLQADVKTYRKNLRLIVGKLMETGAKLIFATTTPYPDTVKNPLRDPGMAKNYNKVAVKIMKKNEIEVDDFYSFILPQITELQLPNNVHFTERGYKALAGKVAESIQAYL